MKRVLKVILVSLGLLILVASLTTVYFVSHFFDVSDSQSESQPATESKPVVTQQIENGKTSLPAMVKPPSPVTKNQEAAETPAPDDEAEKARKHKEKTQLTSDLIEDLVATDKPLSDFCSSLQRANDEVFPTKKSFRETFKRSIRPGESDPRIQSVKPILRYVLRLPEVTKITRIAQAAWERKDKKSLKTLDFFQQAVVAFTQVGQHRQEIEALMDRSYLFYNLNKIAAKRPEILKDSRLHNYCEKIESAFNQTRPVSFDEEKQDFANFMNEVSVKPEEINFDLNYKTDLKLGINRKTLTMEGGWVKELILPDGKNF